MRNKRTAHTVLSVCALFLILNILCAFCPSPFAKTNGLKLVCSFSTDYGESSPERKENVRLGASAIDGSIIFPSEEFSFNGTVGERSEKKGYKNAKVIVKGRYEEGLGGGVCQVSTTLYNAVLLAGLKITECHSHTYNPSYVIPSFDAAVSYGYIDLRFLNDTDGVIVIRARADGKTLTVKVYSTVEPKYKIVRKWRKTEDIPFETLLPDNYLSDTPIIGKNGMVSEGILEYYYQGKLEKTETVRRDKYLPLIYS